jgi:predicted AlkP superfamily pyrophosphatase or phosphodiesterase
LRDTGRKQARIGEVAGVRAQRIFTLAILAIVTLAFSTPASAARTPTIFVLLDGFRADYLDRGETPALSALSVGGIHAKAMRPSFPSVSLPNHVTLITGLRPDRHGMVANDFEDPQMPGMTYGAAGTHARDTTDLDPRWWADAKPIWVSAEQQGVRTAALFYTGSNVAIQGVTGGAAWSAYPRDLPPNARVDAVLERLDLPAGRRPTFITLYMAEVDTAGHFGGPDSAQLTAALHLVDAAIARLVDGLRTRGMLANIVVTADHGMAATSPERIDYIDDHVSAEAVQISGGPFARVFPAAGRQAEVEGKLLGRHGHFDCYRKAEIPKRLQYGTHRRVTAPIFCVSDVGWMLLSRAQQDSPLAKVKGMHGWDPAAPDMAALFIASGPAFKKGVTVPDFDNVDVYPLLAKLIGVRAEANDGDLAPLRAGLIR